MKICLKLLAIAFPLIAFADHWNAAYYNEHSSVQKHQQQLFLDSIKFKSTDHVLDIGCGDGLVSSLIAQKVINGKVTGIDCSYSMIQLAKSALDVEKLNNVTFVKRNIKNIPNPGTFDKVYSYGMLHWMRNQKKSLKSISASLKPNGIAYLQFSNIKSTPIICISNYVSKTRAWRSKFRGYKPHLFAYDSGTYAHILKSANLTPIKIKKVKVEEKFSSLLEFEEWLTAWLPHVEKLQPAMKKAFIADVLKQYIKRYPLDSKGNVYYYDTHWRIVAQKNAE